MLRQPDRQAVPLSDSAASNGAVPKRGPCANAQLLGVEAVPLWLIDDCHPDPSGLREYALEQDFARRDGDYYPGLRAGVPAGYAQWLVALAGTAIKGNAAAEIELRDCTFAIACDNPADLAPIQLIPHFDSIEADLFAAVHYLCAPPFSGTAFYLHRRTGFARIDAGRVALFQQALAADARQFGLPAAKYHAGSSPAFELIGTAPLRFNRIAVYPANCLHSGMLGEQGLSSDPATGRLTITSLLQRITR